MNKDSFIYLKLWSASGCKMFGVFNLSFSVRSQCPSVIVTATLLNKQDRGKCHIELGKTADCGHIPTPLSVYPWVLLIVLASTILIGNHPHAMKCSGQAAAAVCPEYLIEFCCRESFKTLSPTKFEGNVWIWWTYGILVIRIALPEQITFAGKQRSCNCLTITCCWHRRPKKINIFHALPMTSGRGSAINF